MVCLLLFSRAEELDLGRVIGFADFALHAQPMVRHDASRTAVVAVDERPRVSELLRHWLDFDRSVQVAELDLHVCDTLAAYGAAVGGFGVFEIAFVMDTVTAAHEDHGFWRREHVFAANGAIALRGAFDATVGFLDGYVHAHAAGLIRNFSIAPQEE